MNARGALAVAAMLLLAGCSSAPPQPAPMPEPAAGSASAERVPAASASPLEVAPLGRYAPAGPESSAPCLDEGLELLAIPGDPRATALLAGDGEVGIVLGHQSNAYLCQWAPEAERLAALGYSVIVPNLQLNDRLGAMLAAEQRLRADGAERVVLAGASLGGALAIAAAAIVEVPPAGVIALAPPVAFRGGDAHDFAPHVEAPVLLAVGALDGDLPEQADEIAALLPTSPQPLVVADASEHGVALLEHDEARAAFDAFLAEVAPAG